jgi:hypothetical protein
MNLKRLLIALTLSILACSASAQEVNIKLFGAKCDGATNDAAAIQGAVNSLTSGGTVRVPRGNCSIGASTINLGSNVTLQGEGMGASYILASSGDVSQIKATSKTKVAVRDLTVSVSTVGTTAYVGGVHFSSCAYCIVERVEVTGVSWTGIFFDNTTHSIASDNYTHDFRGVVGDSADITVYHASSYNLVSGNRVHAGNDYGILVQDPYTADTPTGNRIVANDVRGSKKGYGIAVYVTTAYDTKTLIENNVVDGVLGTALVNASGACIYVQSAMGTVVNGNTVSNCTQSTTNFSSLGMAGISVTLGDTTTYPTGLVSASVTNNHVSASRGPGIWASTSDVSVLVEGNTINSTGTAAIQGEAIRVTNVKGAKIRGNVIQHVNTNYTPITVTALDTYVMANTEISGNHIATAAYGITVNRTNTATHTNVLVSGNSVSGGNAAAYDLSYITGARVIGNHGTSTTFVFLYTNVTRGRLSGNRFSSAYGTYSIVFTGTNTGSVVDASNDLDGVVENDAGNGTNITLLGDAAPAGSGLWDVGDRVIRRTGSSGSISYWVCTVAGNPGTWSQSENIGAFTATGLNATPVGASTASTGAFTTLTASNAVTLSPANQNVVASPTGTGTVTINPATASAMDNVTIGATTPKAGTFTTATGNTSVVTPLFRSTAAKVLLQGTGTGATQIATTQTTAPTCSSNCGTSPAVAGTDSAMTVTMGASGVPASGWVVTFNGTWAAAPSCSVTPALAGMVVGKQPIVVATTTTTLTVTTNGTAPANSDKYNILCTGVQ